MQKPVIIVGAGGHAKVLVDALLASGREIIGLTDPKVAKGTEVLADTFVLGNDDIISSYDPNDVELVCGLGSVSKTLSRDRLYVHFSNLGYRFAIVSHPSAIISRHAEIGEGCQIMAGAVVQCGVRLAENVVINTSASVDHDCVIGRSSHIAPGVHLSGDVSVGENSHIGTAAAIIQGIRIGKECLVAAGALALADLEDGTKLLTSKPNFPGDSDE